MISPRSLSFRLLAGALVWIAVALGVAGIMLSAMFRSHVEAQHADRMEALMGQLAGAIRAGPYGDVALERELMDGRFRQPYSGLYWQISDASGVPIRRSRSLWDGVLPLPHRGTGASTLNVLRGPDGQRVRALERSVRMPASDRWLRLAVAENLAAVENSLDAFDSVLALSLGMLGIGLAVAAVAQVFGGLLPLGRLQLALAKVRRGETRYLQGKYPDEIAPVVEDLNAVLDEYAALVERARDQAGNLAHSLKTPLAVMANETETLRQRGHVEHAAVLGPEIERMRRQVEYHLARARAAGAARVPGMRTPLLPVLEGLARVMRRIHQERGVEVSLDVPAELWFRGDRQDLEEIAGNLLDNACKWARGRVRGSAAAVPDGIVLFVDDDGPGLPPEQREDVFRRGHRLDGRKDGAGLGLAIVRDLVELYGGTVRLEDAPLGGLRVHMHLPGGGDLDEKD